MRRRFLARYTGMNTVYVAVAVVVLALAALAVWWRRPAAFDVQTHRAYELQVQGQAVRVEATADKGAVLKPQGAGSKVRLTPAPGALDGVAGATGVAYTVANLNGRRLGTMVSEYRLTMAWDAADPVYLEVRGDGTALLRASGTCGANVESDGFVDQVFTGVAPYRGPGYVATYDCRNMAMHATLAPSENRPAVFFQPPELAMDGYSPAMQLALA